MGRELQRLKRRKATTKHMEELLDHAPTTLVVHYSCESFYDRTDGRTVRAREQQKRAIMPVALSPKR